MNIEKTTNGINKATGLLIIEVINSNPNGDPDRESDPRQRNDGRGEISPVSFKRKLRDLVEEKNGPVWAEMSKYFLPNEEFEILESRGRDRKKILEEIDNNTFIKKYWDARVFGNTFLQEGVSSFVKTGVVQFGLGVSISPVLIERQTTTNKAGVEIDKDRGMAPLSYRIVQHGVYSMPFFVNPTAAVKSGCSLRDIDLMLKLIPYAYTHSASYIRPFVEIRHCWYIKHNSPLGSYSDFAIIEALMPKRKAGQNPNVPSTCWEDYFCPIQLGEEIKNKIESIRDIMND